jgi:hypothetical protein
MRMTNRESIITGIVLTFLLFFCPIDSILADALDEADALFTEGGIDNFQAAIELYRRVLVHNEKDFEANWKCARAYRTLGKTIIKEQQDGWKKQCTKYGKLGIEYAEKAIELNPKRPEGYYYYSLSVGTYADGVSILTALAEGLKSKTQKGLEKAYDMDKMYDSAGPILALGRFWSVLPWPLKDKQKALAYYREYQETEYFATTVKAKIYLAELLLDINGSENRKEALDLLGQAAQTESEFYSKWAGLLLAKNR